MGSWCFWGKEGGTLGFCPRDGGAGADVGVDAFLFLALPFMGIWGVHAAKGHIYRAELGDGSLILLRVGLGALLGLDHNFATLPTLRDLL